MSISSSAPYVPEKLKFLINRLENYRVQNLKLTAESTSTANSTDRIVFNLPAQGLADISSFTLSGTYKAITDGGVLPQNGVSGLIQRIDVSAGGVVISSCQNYNQLHQILRQWTTDPQSNRQRAIGSGQAGSGVVQGGDELVAPFVVGNFTDLVDTTTATLKSSGEQILRSTAKYVKNISRAVNEELPFNLNSWIDFLGVEQGHVMDLSTLPAPLQIQITLDGSRVLGGAGTADFQLTNLYAKLRVIEFPMLSRGIMSMLDSGNTLSVPFNRYLSYSFANDSGALISNRFSVATQCLSKLWVNNVRTANYTQIAGSTKGRNNAMFISDADKSNNYWVEVDNRRVSSYNIDLPQEGYEECLQALGAKHEEYDNLYGAMGVHNRNANVDGNTADYGTYNYFNSAFAMVFNFGYNDWDTDSNANVSGYNTNGLSSSLAIQSLVGNQSANHTMNVFAETKAVLNIQKGRVISVDY